MYDLTGFQRDILLIVAGLENPKGLAIKNEMEDYYVTGVHSARLYPNLDALVEKGLIKKGKKDNRTNEYRVTDRGLREIKARFEWEGECIDSLVSEPVSD